MRAPTLLLPQVMIALLAGLAPLVTGCIEETETPNNNTDAGARLDGAVDPDGGVGPDGSVEPVEESHLRLTYVSGHLGSYWDCPDEALAAPADAREQGDPAGPPAGEAAADCAEDSPDCGGPLNCTPAMVILQVENLGDAAIDQLSAGDLSILMDPPVRSEVVTFIDATPDPITGEQAGGVPGDLAPGGILQLRIEFRGPANDVGGWDAAWPVEVEVKADGAAPATVVTPPLSRLPAVAT